MSSMSSREIDWSTLQWTRLEEQLTILGYAHHAALLPSEACRDLVALYSQDSRFRKRIDMERFQFGLGEYSYFSEPLPSLVAFLRTTLYKFLAPVANRLMQSMRVPVHYPTTLNQFRRNCRAAGQIYPTPLMLRYRVGGFNCLHRDIYGPTVFPLQAMVMLSQPGTDFSGGEFVLVENRPRLQARSLVVTPNQGDLLIFPVSERPVPGKRGILRATMRHGVSRLHSGQRWTLGIIFHDAKT